MTRTSRLLADRIREVITGRMVVLIDGGSGAGKTELGTDLAEILGAQLISLDGFYPGWGGLEAGSAMVRGCVLHPETPGWRRWDWARHRTAEWRAVDGDAAIVIEGSGALSAANRAVAGFGIWIQLDETERKRRALERDGDLYAEHWERWALQEHAFFARERPDLIADAVVDGWTGELLR